MTVNLNELRAEPARLEREAGDAFETIFRKHWSRVYGVLFRILGDRAEAEDLALEVFWRLYRRPPTPRREQSLAGWLYRVATNLGLNAVRARKRRKSYEQEAGRQALAAAPIVDPASEAERAVEREQVRQTLFRMKPRAAKLLLLRHTGLSYAELAAALGVAPGSIGALLARAEREFERRYRETSEVSVVPNSGD